MRSDRSDDDDDDDDDDVVDCERSIQILNPYQRESQQDFLPSGLTDLLSILRSMPRRSVSNNMSRRPWMLALTLASMVRNRSIKLGRGSFGAVRLSVDGETGIRYAIKELSKSRLKRRFVRGGMTGLRRMMSMMRRVRRMLCF
ncbi:hypothetical protein BY996DRAFT_931890 [Phakopsora pachyrhizi]|nr:hypothetical protein BY996DRAFT_931890 [Phakopsora pachyrhizi]